MSQISVSYQHEMYNPMISMGLAQVVPPIQSSAIRPNPPVQSYSAGVSNYIGIGDVQINTDIYGIVDGKVYAPTMLESPPEILEANAAERDPWLEKFDNFLKNLPQARHKVDSSREGIY